MSRKSNNRQRSDKPNVEPEAIRHAQPLRREDSDENARRTDRDLDMNEETDASNNQDTRRRQSDDLDED